MGNLLNTPLAEARRGVEALGAEFNPTVLAATTAIYAPLVSISDPAVNVVRDAAFGAHPRQRLDVYHPVSASGASPVLVFIPGGGFVAGGKDEHPSFYANIGTYFAAHDVVAVIANYRLAPEFGWEDQTADVGAAVDWAVANAATYGGDPGRVNALGQSAGAANLAAYLFHPRYDGRAEAAGLRSAILMSGVYRYGDGMPPDVQQYAGASSGWEDRSPITHVGRSRLPLTLCLAQLDPAFLAIPTLELAAAVTARDGQCPPLHVFEGHNHVSTVQSIGSADDSVGGTLRASLSGY